MSSAGSLLPPAGRRSSCFMLCFSEVMLRRCSCRYSCFRLSQRLLGTHGGGGSLAPPQRYRGALVVPLLGEDAQRDDLLADLQLLLVLLLPLPLGFEGRVVSVLFAVSFGFALDDGP